MGYTTEFEGRLTFPRPLAPAQVLYLQRFNGTRRMKRDEVKAGRLPDPNRLAVGLSVGEEGGYYVGADDGNFGQTDDASVLDHNNPPAGQPGLWCKWTVTDDGKHLEWDGAEKFYAYVPWLNYLTEHFFRRWDNLPSGTIAWRGEDRSDVGVIRVTTGEVVVEKGPPKAVTGAKTPEQLVDVLNSCLDSKSLCDLLSEDDRGRLACMLRGFSGYTPIDLLPGTGQFFIDSY